MQNNQEVIPNHIELEWVEEHQYWKIKCSINNYSRALKMLANEK